MLGKLLGTDSKDYLALWMRIILGGVFSAHGAQKALGWFGGAGFSNTLIFFQNGLRIPVLFAVAAIIGELLAGLALLAGFLTRAAAVGIGVIMVTAVLMVHARNGFFMNWLGNQAGEGFEYHLLALGLVAPLIARGGGAFSFDSTLTR